MGKIKKRKSYGDKISKPKALADQILNERVASPSVRMKLKDDKNDGDDEYVEGSIGRSIIKQSLAQLKELNDDDKDEEWPALGAPIKRKRREVNVSVINRGFKKKSFKKVSDLNEKDVESENESDAESSKAVPLNVERVVAEFEDELKIDPEDLDILHHFQNKNANPQRKLADLFRDKITEKRTEIQTEIDTESRLGSVVPPDKLEMCREIGKILHHYRSGPLPKMFKVFPQMTCWEELLYATDPDKWTAAAMYQATRIFIAHLKPSMAQRFCYLVLLPRIRDDISYFKKLNFHLYQALRKALYKSAAFFKGIVLPLCSEGNCTLREAIIIGSVIAKNHIPIANSAAAIMKIASMDYSGSNSIFLRILFDKKYALPYQVIDECVEHFKRFQTDKRILPVLWHQSLLSFVQRYKNDFSSEQREDLHRLIGHQRHYKITPQIQRELDSAVSREAMAVD